MKSNKTLWYVLGAIIVIVVIFIIYNQGHKNPNRLSGRYPGIGVTDNSTESPVAGTEIPPTDDNTVVPPPATPTTPGVNTGSSTYTLHKEAGRYVDRIFSESQIKITSNVVYGQAVNVSGVNESLTMDIYEPIETSSTLARPLIITIHGGGFSAGDKTNPNQVSWSKEWFAERGYVSASINYRLTKQNNDSTGPLEAVSDAQAAIRWFRAHATDYHIDPNRIVTMGSSAGAIMALFTAAADDNVGNFTALDSQVKENTSNPGYPSWVCFAASASGTIPDPLRTEIVDAGDSPITDFHGELDTTVLYQSAVDTINAFKAKGIFAQLYSYASYGHGVPEDDVEAKIIPILLDHVINGACPATNMTVAAIK